MNIHAIPIVGKDAVEALQRDIVAGLRCIVDAVSAATKVWPPASLSEPLSQLAKFDAFTSPSPKMISAITSVWNDTPIKEFCVEKPDIELPGGGKEGFKNLMCKASEYFDPSYQPTNDDLTKCYGKTPNIIKTVIPTKCGYFSWIFYDLSALPADERTDTLQDYVDIASGIIYFVSLDEWTPPIAKKVKHPNKDFSSRVKIYWTDFPDPDPSYFTWNDEWISAHQNSFVPHHIVFSRKDLFLPVLNAVSDEVFDWEFGGWKLNRGGMPSREEVALAYFEALIEEQYSDQLVWYCSHFGNTQQEEYCKRIFTSITETIKKNTLCGSD